MKQGLLLTFFALSLLITSCGKDDDNRGNWKKSADYAGAGRGGAVCFTIDKDVYIGLGYSEGNYFSSFYKYNVDGTNWTKDSDFPGTRRREGIAFSVNGKGYIGLGVDENNNRLGDFWEFDPATKEWTEVALNLEEGQDFSARQGAIAFAFDLDDDGINDVAYVGTGYGFLDGEDRNNLKDFLKFDGTTWAIDEDYPGSKTSDAMSFTIGKKAYLVSGYDNYDNVWEFDATTEKWTQKRDIDKNTGAANVQRTNGAAFVIKDLAYITTGDGQNSREVWEYHPKTDKWVKRNNVENEFITRFNAIGFSIDGKGFIATGSNGTRGLSDMWEYQPNVEENNDDND